MRIPPWDEPTYVQLPLLEEKSEQNSGAGRTTYILKPTSDKVISIGLDINISGLSCEIVSLNSQTIKRFTDTLTAKTQNDVITQSETLLKVALDYCNENELQVFSLGIAMQGSVNELKSMHASGGFTLEMYDRASLERLHAEFYESARLIEDAISFSGDDDEMFRVIGFIKENGMSIRKLERTEASLESLFMEVIGK
jgi:hypothetical protein